MTHSAAEKAALKALLQKHRIKNPGCKLWEKACNKRVSPDCIGKGNASIFHGRTCPQCRAVYNRQAHEQRIGRPVHGRVGRPKGAKNKPKEDSDSDSDQ